MTGFVKSALAGGIMAALLGRAAWAQDYPDGPVTFLVGYSAGGQADVLARTVAEGLSRQLDETVVVENKPGANGLLAAQTAAQGKPDGQTILLVTNAMTGIEPQLASSQQWDPKTELAPAIDLGDGPLFFAVNASNPATTVKELAENAKAEGRTISFGTSGTATPHRMSVEEFAEAAGVQVKHVAYKGTSASVADLAGGTIDMAVGSITSIQPLIDAGKVKLLANAGAERDPNLPDVPTVAETYPGIDFKAYYGVMVHKDTPPEIVAELNGALNAVLADPALADTFTGMGVIPTGGTPEDFARRITDDTARYGTVLAKLGLKAE